MDGHSGIENNQINKGGSGNFQLFLSYLKQSTGLGEFVIHASSSTFYSSGLQPLEFLQQIGFKHFQGECKFFHDRCFYRTIAEVKYDRIGFEDTRQTMMIHNTFETFANEGINKLYELQKQQNDLLRTIGLSSGSLEIFNIPAKIEIKPAYIPIWLNSIKFEHLKELESQKADIDKEIEGLEGFLPLVFANGDTLVYAVLKALKFLGLKAKPTEPAFTIDILAETIDGLMKFGFEVTGINDPIRKDSKKLTQLLEFERIKEHNEKTILIANTFKNIPISERKGRENFTADVVKFLSGFPILLMTGWDLYRAVGDMIEKKKEPSYFVERFYKDVGIFIFDK